MKITYTDIKDKKEFNRNDYHYVQIKADDINHIYLYELVPLKWNTPHKHYELIKGIKVKNPDGSIAYRYPTSEEFGTYGWYICGTPKHTKKRIAERWHSLIEVGTK